MLAPSKSEGLPSPTAPSPSPDRSGHFLLLTTSSVNSMSGVYPEPVGALSFSDLSLFPFNFKLSTLNPVAFIDAASSISPLFAALTENTRGGYLLTPNPTTSSFFHIAHTPDTQDRPQLQSLHAIAHAFRHTRGCTHFALQFSISPVCHPERSEGPAFSWIATSLPLYFITSSSVPHGTKPPLARLHRCGGDVHA